MRGFNPATGNARRLMGRELRNSRATTDPDNLRSIESVRGLAQREDARGDERNRDFSTCQTHRRNFSRHSARQKIPLSWKLEADLVHPAL
jgi:hypothetical protein